MMPQQTLVCALLLLCGCGGSLRYTGAGDDDDDDDDDHGQGDDDDHVDQVYTLAAGAVHTCADLDDLACWGLNLSGQLDAPAGVGPFVELSAGGSHTCGRLAGGGVVCWGSNASGQCSVPE